MVQLVLNRRLRKQKAEANVLMKLKRFLLTTSRGMYHAVD